VFGSDHGALYALDARSGQILWNVETGGVIYGAPITYSGNGEQLVTVITGRNMMTFGLPKMDANLGQGGQPPH
jgi:outer membrane protein assembly factor BamB